MGGVRACKCIMSVSVLTKMQLNVCEMGLQMNTEQSVCVWRPHQGLCRSCNVCICGCRSATLASVPSGPRAVIGHYGPGNNAQVAVIDATRPECNRAVSNIKMTT